MSPEDTEALRLFDASLKATAKDIAEKEAAPPEFDEIVCGHCAAFEPFPWDEKCEGGCAKPHESVRGLCRLNSPVVDPCGAEKGRWPVVNVDDWCMEGRELVWQALHPKEDE